jgi:micrococcal nuclease
MVGFGYTVAKTRGSLRARGSFFLMPLIVALAVPTGAPSADQDRFALRGTVEHVVDGDTVDVRLASGRRERIRLIGIDSPELRPAECLGAQARTRARHLAQGRRVRLVGDATQDTRDRYKRLLAYVMLSPDRDLGRQLVREGLAEVFVYRRPFQRLSGYRSAERGAKTRQQGLWSRCAAGTQPPAPPPPPPPGPPAPPPPHPSCAASYPDACIPPPPPDLDCGQIGSTNVRVRWDVPNPDPHGFDGDRDGIGCET